MNLGFPELAIILVIVLVIFGGGKLPAIGDALGRSIRNFKKAATSENEIDVTPAAKDQLPPASANTAPRTEQAQNKA